MSKISYRNVWVQTAGMPRTRLFDLPFNIRVTCTRTAGWEVWQTLNGEEYLLAGEHGGSSHDGLKIDIDGHTIINTLPVEDGILPVSKQNADELEGAIIVDLRRQIVDLKAELSVCKNFFGRLWPIALEMKEKIDNGR